MKYIDFLEKVKEPIFSLQYLKLLNLPVLPYQLTSWADKGYLIKLKNGIYCLANKKEQLKPEYIAFKLYQPSYISLEWALHRYGLIPDIPYNPTSITSKTTKTFHNELGAFLYRHIKNDLFFGYKKIINGEQAYLLAEPEKALIDYLYLNAAKIKTKEDVEELRFNPFSLAKLRKGRIKQYSQIAQNERLNKILALIFQK